MAVTVGEQSSAKTDPAEPKTSGQRLQHHLAEAGIGSRRECEEYIVLGRVTVDGVVVTELGTRVDPRTQTVQFDGETVGAEPKVYWWLNKPKGVLSTSRDTHGRPVVTDFVPPIGRRVYAVGRLDENSTGLMLLTNDGALAYRLTHPKFGVPKTYDVLVAGKVTPSTLLRLRKGVWLAEGKVRPRDVHRLGTRGDATRLRVVLAEGMNREIRRMFARIGHKVMALERIGIGPVRMRQLRLGQARAATGEEVRLLRSALEPRPRSPKSARTGRDPKPERKPRQVRGRRQARRRKQ